MEASEYEGARARERGRIKHGSIDECIWEMRICRFSIWVYGMLEGAEQGIEERSQIVRNVECVGDVCWLVGLRALCFREVHWRHR